MKIKNGISCSIDVADQEHIHIHIHKYIFSILIYLSIFKRNSSARALKYQYKESMTEHTEN